MERKALSDCLKWFQSLFLWEAEPYRTLSASPTRSTRENGLQRARAHTHTWQSKTYASWLLRFFFKFLQNSIANMIFFLVCFGPSSACITLCYYFLENLPGNCSRPPCVTLIPHVTIVKLPRRWFSVAVLFWHLKAVNDIEADSVGAHGVVFILLHILSSIF